MAGLIMSGCIDLDRSLPRFSDHPRSQWGTLGGSRDSLYNYSLSLGVAIVFLTSEIGWRLGIRTKGHDASGNISALEQSLLGLLALIIGFTFLMALTRFEARREAVLMKRTRLARQLFAHASCQHLIGRNH